MKATLHSSRGDKEVRGGILSPACLCMTQTQRAAVCDWQLPSLKCLNASQGGRNAQPKSFPAASPFRPLGHSESPGHSPV